MLLAPPGFAWHENSVPHPFPCAGVCLTSEWERLVLPCISVQNIHRQYGRIQYGCQDNDSRRIPVRAVITALVNLFESTEQKAKK